jgi:glycerol-3-phosphate dehydrogenase
VGLTWDAFQGALGNLSLEGLLPESALRHLHQQYGHGALGILREVKACPSQGEPLLDGQPFCAAEIHHILAFENAPHLADVMARRTEMQMTVSHTRQRELASKVAALLACRYGWDDARTGRELDFYLAQARSTVSD